MRLNVTLTLIALVLIVAAGRARSPRPTGPATLEVEQIRDGKVVWRGKYLVSPVGRP